MQRLIQLCVGSWSSGIGSLRHNTVHIWGEPGESRVLLDQKQWCPASRPALRWCEVYAWHQKIRFRSTKTLHRAGSALHTLGGYVLLVLERFDWISFILIKRCVTFYGVPCLSLSTSNHNLRISVVVGTRCLNQQCIFLHFNTCLLFLPCCVVLDNRGITLWSHWTTSKSCIDINRITISVQYDAGWPYHDNPWLQF